MKNIKTFNDLQIGDLIYYYNVIELKGYPIRIIDIQHIKDMIEFTFDNNCSLEENTLKCMKDNTVEEFSTYTLDTSIPTEYFFANDGDFVEHISKSFRKLGYLRDYCISCQVNNVWKNKNADERHTELFDEDDDD